MIKLVYIICCCITLALTGCGPDTTEITWDLSTSQNISQVGWPSGRTDMFYSKSGNIDLTLQLPKGKVVSENVSYIECEREGDQIGFIRFKSQALTKEDAYARAKYFAKYFDFTDGDMGLIDDWYHGVTKPPMNDDRLKVIEDYLRRPGVVLQTMHTYENEKPWVFSLELDFARVR